ncbi:hypothetical protein PanWU01x14_113460 [Parasponia andersonii]|uniref:Uncharacterized protein n=1 Tax=Parasponia andersonii TaxID=3476 RepID=A0A2P5CXW0_PARAD|nr:hypothetical protein PanWU01x14_113460 [Parasponia andersonii]
MVHNSYALQKHLLEELTLFENRVPVIMGWFAGGNSFQDLYSTHGHYGASPAELQVNDFSRTPPCIEDLVCNVKSLVEYMELNEPVFEIED